MSPAPPSHPDEHEDEDGHEDRREDGDGDEDGGGDGCEDGDRGGGEDADDTRYSQRLVSKTNCNLVYAIRIVHNKCGCLTPRRFVSKTSCILIYMSVHVLLPRLASRSICVNCTQQMWMRYPTATCIKDKLHLNIHMCERACVKILL